MKEFDVAVVGAGPYGLAAAAHLRDRGVGAQVFGQPLRFWREQTPDGMFLRSPYGGSDIGDPHRRLTLQHYERATTPVTLPIPVERFIDYGSWFQQQAVPDLDTREVLAVRRAGDGFEIELFDDRVRARKVVVAAGVGNFAFRPPQFADSPTDRVSHSLDHSDLGKLRGQRVVIVGAGQSALESAALLHEADCEITVLVRQHEVVWLEPASWRHRFPIGNLLYGKPDVGPAGVSQLVARPNLYRRLPRRVQDRLGPRSVRPAGAAWLPERLRGVEIRCGVEVRRCGGAPGLLRLELSDGSTLEAGHVLLATGYRVDLGKYRFLDPALVAQIDCVGSYPSLTRGFETSVRGLHVVGAPAAFSFGPLMRFVAGSQFAARSLALHAMR